MIYSFLNKDLIKIENIDTYHGGRGSMKIDIGGDGFVIKTDYNHSMWLSYENLKEILVHLKACKEIKSIMNKNKI